MASSQEFPAPPEPCKGCKFEGCRVSPLINRLAIEAWLSDQQIGCDDYKDDPFHGVEGCYA
jgi:hypothetical protein